MANRAYVGNLPFTYTPQDLQQLFAGYGTVRSAEIVQDRLTGRSRGFGFVELDTPEALRAAMQALDGSEINGRPLTVNEARERTPRERQGPRPGGGGFDRGRSPEAPRFAAPREGGYSAGSVGGHGAGGPRRERGGERGGDHGGRAGRGERHERGERHDRSERYSRSERYERGDRRERDDRYERD